MKAILTLLLIGLFFSKPLLSQEITETPLDTLTRSVSNLLDENSKSKRLKITGYLQPQYQYIDSAGAPSYAGGDFATTSGTITSPYYSRFMMRRGRFKFTYTHENVEYLCNIDATERGLNMRETFVKVSDPWKNVLSITVGLLQDQFGFELTQSSGVRETPERARVNQILFPTERDLGAFVSYVAPKSSSIYGLKVDAAVMNGAAGVAPEFDSNKDFTGRVQYSKTTKNEKISYAVGASGYYGGYRVGSVKDYNSGVLANGETGFIISKDSAKFNRIAKRIYYGADAQFSIDWSIGITTLRAEYIQGEQPGTDNNNRSPATLQTRALYHRNFNAGYFYYIQNIGQSRFQVVLKYDWYDPNVKISEKQIGKTGTNTKIGDISFNTFGFGTTYRINSYAKLMLYYDIVKNEKTSINGYTGDIKDNVFTARMQVRF
jgi:phosphate-selective porin